MFRWGFLGIIALLQLSLVSCTISTGGGKGEKFDLGQIYNEAARHHGPERRPVILIPGVLGSQLHMAESGELVWGEHILKGANPTKAEGQRMLALPMEKGKPLSALQDGVEAFGVLDRVKVSLLFGSIESKAY